MKNYRIKYTIYVIVGISAIAWSGLSFVNPGSLNSISGFLQLIPSVVTIDLIFISIFSKWLWKKKLFAGWLVPFDNLNGTWIGYIRSSWVDEETGKRVPQIPTMLTIKQSFFRVNCKMYTGEMISHSTTEGFNLDNERQVKQLVYTYTSKPSVLIDGRSLPHEGTMVFDIINKPQRILKGSYWTDRKTTGEIILNFYSDELLETLPRDSESHPMDKQEAVD